MPDLRHILYLSAVHLLVCECLNSLPAQQNYISLRAAARVPVLSVTRSFTCLFRYFIRLHRFEIHLKWINSYSSQYSFKCRQFYTCLLLVSKLQSQFLCVKVLFLAARVRMTQTVSQSIWKGQLCLHCKCV